MLNEYQQTLWDDLMTLVNESETFYYSDQQMNNDWFRIFNYRLASYTEFLRPNGIECRGHMFMISEEGPNATPIQLSSLPMAKFWNLNENPSTMDLDLSTITDVWEKADGSLISTYLSSDGELLLKSKGSLSSDQALAAMEWMDNNEKFKKTAHLITLINYSVNFEWTSPDNRIVLPYSEPQLHVLNARSLEDGHYIEYDLLAREFGNEYMVEKIDVSESYENFMSSVPDMLDIEGFVVRLESGQFIKIKTNWYLALHRTKDNVNSPRRLFECVLEEATDDMKTLFVDDPLALKTIEDMEKWTAEKYNHFVDTVERFYNRNKHLSRKEYAILGQQELKDTFYFGPAMSLYVGRDVNYKEFLKGKWKQLGLTDLEKGE